MRRVTPTQLADLAFQNPGSEIEPDKDAGPQFLTVKGSTYYASLETDEERAS